MASQPLKWHGGKHYLAKEIISRFPPHVHYVEPFFGGGAVLFSKPAEWIEGHSEVVNDLNRGLVNFWDVLREHGSRLKDFLKLTPFSQEEWKRAKRICEMAAFNPSSDQGAAMLGLLSGIKGKFILSGYHSPLYDHIAKESGWRCDEIQIDNKASGKKTKDVKTECLWMNF